MTFSEIIVMYCRYHMKNAHTVCDNRNESAVLMYLIILSVISRFRRDVDETSALLAYYAASSRNPLPTFRDNVSLPSSTVKKSWYRYNVPRSR
jgi:hypothetical protein